MRDEKATAAHGGRRWVGRKDGGNSMEKGTTRMVVTVPTGCVKTLREIRDYIVESLQVGILVLDERMEYRMEDFPDLGDVMVLGELPPPAALTEGTDTAVTEETPKYSGRTGGEKREILSRLMSYREHEGLGCLDAVAREAGGKIRAGTLRDLLTGNVSVSIEEWRMIGRALDKLEKE